MKALITITAILILTSCTDSTKDVSQDNRINNIEQSIEILIQHDINKNVLDSIQTQEILKLR